MQNGINKIQKNDFVFLKDYCEVIITSIIVSRLEFKFNLRTKYHLNFILKIIHPLSGNTALSSIFMTIAY